MAVVLVLKTNNGVDGKWRKEVILTNKGIAIATSQRAFIDIGFGRNGYDHDVMHLTTSEMDILVEWWQRLKQGGEVGDVAIT